MFRQTVVGEFTYPVVFTNGTFQGQCELWQLLHHLGKTTAKLQIFVDDGLAKSNQGLLAIIRDWGVSHGLQLGDVKVLAGGEVGKEGLINPTRVIETLVSRQMDRHDLVVAIGGGAFLDGVGLGAGLFHRGIGLIRMPTTVLSQNDAGIGVKNGVNFLGQKNCLGMFKAPLGVINDSSFLASLPLDIKREGLSEAIKVALLKSPYFFDWLFQNRFLLGKFHKKTVEYMIRETARLHLEHIQGGGDPFEEGRQRPLDFGHWFAHRLEILSDHRVSHGAGVASGLWLDLSYSVAVLGLDPMVLAAYEAILAAVGLQKWQPHWLVDHVPVSRLLEGIEQFRQHIGGPLALPMLTEVGQVVSLDKVDMGVMATLLSSLICNAETGAGHYH